MKQLIRFIALLYPASWRARYGAEFEALIEAIDPNWQVLLDTLKEALKMQVSTWNTGNILVATGIAGMVIGLGVSLALPRQYASQVVIHIVPSTNTSMKNESVVTQVNLLAGSVISQSSLTSIVEGLGLYGSGRAETPPAEAIDRMKRSISIRPASLNRNGKPAFVIQFVYSDPVVAQRVAQHLAARFLDENLRENLANRISTTLAITKAASLPTRPFIPSRWKNSTIGLAAGLFLGLLAAMFRNPPKATSA